MNYATWIARCIVYQQPSPSFSTWMEQFCVGEKIREGESEETLKTPAFEQPKILPAQTILIPDAEYDDATIRYSWWQQEEALLGYYEWNLSTLPRIHTRWYRIPFTALQNYTASE